MKKRRPNSRVSPPENLLPQFLGGLTGNPIAEGTKYQIGDFGADNFGELTVFDLDFFDRGTYECNITNVHASQSREPTLDVQGT